MLYELTGAYKSYRFCLNLYIRIHEAISSLSLFVTLHLFYHENPITIKLGMTIRVQTRATGLYT